MICAHCLERPATCIGSYEGAADFTPACDECCGHGCEDGQCEPIRKRLKPPSPGVTEGGRESFGVSPPEGR